MNVMASLFDPSCASAYGEVFSDDSDTDWCCLRYEGRKLKCAPSGKGSDGLDGLVETFDDSQVQYGLLRMIKMDDGGDSKRIKFVFISWVGENAPAMKKGSVTSHKPMVAELFKGHHVSLAVMERCELDSLAERIKEALVKAGGANYDLGNIRSGVQAGGTGAIKNASKSFFQQKDAETEVKNVVFASNIRVGKEISACDLGNRAMTASASEAKRNIVGYSSSSTAAPSAAVASSGVSSQSAANVEEERATESDQAPAAPEPAAQVEEDEDATVNPQADGSVDKPKATTAETYDVPDTEEEHNIKSDNKSMLAANDEAALVEVEAKEE